MSHNTIKTTVSWLALAGLAAMMTACNSSSRGGHGGNDVIYYPYENVYGDACTSTTEPTPGCTFNEDDGSRVHVSQSDDYNYNMWEVEFDGSGEYARVYDEFGDPVYDGSGNLWWHISEFDGWQGDNYIGVGTTGVFWEDVTYGTYLWDSNGVLFDDNYSDSDYGDAINNEGADEAVNTDVIALNEKANEALVKKGTQKLVQKYGFAQDKAKAVASSLNRFSVNLMTRGYSTPEDIKQSFESTFGVDYKGALSAVRDLVEGDPSGMQNLTQRSANALGLKPRQAKQFIKDSYGDALADFGYTGSDLDW